MIPGRTVCFADRPRARRQYQACHSPKRDQHSPKSGGVITGCSVGTGRSMLDYVDVTKPATYRCTGRCSRHIVRALYRGTMRTKSSWEKGQMPFGASRRQPFLYRIIEGLPLNRWPSINGLRRGKNVDFPYRYLYCGNPTRRTRSAKRGSEWRLSSAGSTFRSIKPVRSA